MNKNILTEEQIKEIADQIDMGFKCFWSKKDGSLRFVPDEVKFYGMDLERFEEDMDFIDENMGSFDVFLPLESHESFKIMEEFAESLSDSNRLKEKLFRALNNRKPFQGFRWVIDDSGEYRDVWFRFKDQWMRNWVKRRMEDILECRNEDK